jgi:hypothetical protein
MYHAMEALVGAGLLPLPHKSVETADMVLSGAVITDEDEKRGVDENIIKLTVYPTLDQLHSSIQEESSHTIKPPSIEPLEYFIEKRAVTIEALKQLRVRMAKDVLNCKISSTVGNSTTIIGGILCFVFPPVGVPVLLAGSATTLGKYVYFLIVIIKAHLNRSNEKQIWFLDQVN